MKILSWNVNGIRAAWGHGLSDFIATSNADIFAFQETKLYKPLPYMELDGYYPFWSFCKRAKGYFGTMCLSRWRPIAVSYDFTLPSEVKEHHDTFGHFHFSKFYPSSPWI